MVLSRGSNLLGTNRDHYIELVVEMCFASMDSADKFIWGNHRLDLALQMRLIGKPYLVVSIDGKDVIRVEDPWIFTWLRVLSLNKGIIFKVYVEEMDDEAYNNFEIFIQERHKNTIDYLLSMEKFKNQYGFYIGENNYV